MKCEDREIVLGIWSGARDVTGSVFGEVVRLGETGRGRQDGVSVKEMLSSGWKGITEVGREEQMERNKKERMEGGREQVVK